MNFLRANPALEFIDVNDAAGSTTGNGHAYFRKSPWVSSDLLVLLSQNMGAAERGLEKEANLPVWAFPPDFIERLRKVLTKMNPNPDKPELKIGTQVSGVRFQVSVGNKREQA